MERERLWPDFRPEWIVFEDDALIAVDKPVGVPSQSPDPAHPDDVVTRLRAHLATRDDARPYLGVHQRLDQHTSGVMLFAKRKDANPGLARQFEGRTVVKEYVAAVEGLRGQGGTLRHRLGRAPGGAVRVLPGTGRGGKAAVTHVRVRARRGGRSLVDVRIETGRTHQIRVQLAHEGAPVAGDAVYGGAPASRLMLHARALTLAHPLTGARMRLEAPLPDDLARWVEGQDAVPLDDPDGLRAAVERAAHLRFGLARAGDGPEPTTCFRLLNGAGDGVPGLVLDVYDAFVVAHLYEDLTDDVAGALYDVLEGLGFDGVYLKRHPRQANVMVDAKAAGLAPPEPIRGRAAPPVLEVREHGVPYRVRLGEGLGTGLFLDQRDNRRRVRGMAHGTSVLNLFAHTCGFTVAAAAGGARRTVSVDASQAVLDRGREQVLAMDPKGQHAFVRSDVFRFLGGAAARGDRFDVVVVDPPTYSSTRASRWRSGADWRHLAAAVLAVTAPGGRILVCSNDLRLPQQKLRRYIHEGARAAGREVLRLRDHSPPRDHPAAPGVEPQPKAMTAELA